MKYFIANWKEHKTIEEATVWIKEFMAKPKHEGKIEIVICPSDTLISTVHDLVKNTEIEVGSQNISKFEEGAHTGEVSAKMIRDLVSYSIVGHSERRALGETEEDIKSKIEMLKKNNIKSILCIRNEKDIIYEDAEFVAYEPVGAIGTGENISLDQIIEMKQKLSLADKRFIYGGSVNADNIREYIDSDEIDGFLVATASLDPQSFYNIIAAV